MEARLNLFASPVTANAVKHIIAAGKVRRHGVHRCRARRPGAQKCPAGIGQTAERSSVRRRRSRDCAMAGGL